MNRNFFLQTWGVRRDVDLVWKGLKAAFDKTSVKDAVPSKPRNSWLRQEDFEFQREAVSVRQTLETNGCLHGRSVDRGIMLFPVILLCIHSSFWSGRNSHKKGGVWIVTLFKFNPET